MKAAANNTHLLFLSPSFVLCSGVAYLNNGSKNVTTILSE